MTAVPAFPQDSAPIPVVAGVPERLAFRVVQAGAVAVVLVASTFRQFELDRFFVPKELVLHATALLAGLLAVRAFGRARFGRIDLLLGAFLLASGLSAWFATNPWLAIRALGVSLSSIVLFWSARALRAGGLARPLQHALALAVVVTAATSLAQTYGVDLLLFSENRAPGGTLGNRNFVAHVAAFGFPLLVLSALGARGAGEFLLASLGTAATIASLVLTRSRAAWLAFAVGLMVFLVAMVASAPQRGDGRTWRRLAAILLIAGGGVAAALLVPNSLEWRSRNPYLDSVKRVADYEQGSGRGRLVQYGRSLRLALSNPLLGVGPGNWAVEYPSRVPPSDPSLDDSEPGVTLNPWPSSDWVAWISERGAPATVFLALAFAGMAAAAARRLVRATTVEESHGATALLCTLTAAGITGLFDAVLLTAVPAFLVWSILGLLFVPESQGAGRRVVLLLLALAAGAAAARSGAQMVAMQIFATRGDRASLVRAARIDPGNYRLRMRLARSGNRRQRCEHARAAHALLPAARAAAGLSRGCGE